MLESLLSIHVADDGAITEVFEIICPMTGFRTRHSVTHLGEGIFQSEDLGPA
jgi:hypothetical protein